MNAPSPFRPCACARLLHAVFGHVQYEAPPWLRAAARRWKPLLALVLVLAAAGGGVRWYLQWSDAHRMRSDAELPVREAAVSLAAPEYAMYGEDGKQNFSPLTVAFSCPAAALSSMGDHDSPPEGSVSLSPEMPGRWTWTNAKTLVFRAERDWLPGTEYRVTLGHELLAPEVHPSSRELVWTSQPFGVREKTMNFAADLAEGGACRLSGRLLFTHPVSPEEVKKHTVMRAVSAEDAEAKRPGEPLELAWTPGKTPCEFFFRSAPVQVPERDGIAVLTLASDLKAEAGGKPLGKEVVVRERIPNRFGLLRPRQVVTKIVPDRVSGEPRRLLFIQMASPVVPAEVDGQPEIRRITREALQPSNRERQWEHSLPLRLTSELRGEARQRPTDTLVYSYEESDHGESDSSLLVRVPAGLRGVGGFVQKDDAYFCCRQVPFESSIDVAGDGCLALRGGEQKIRVTTRNVRYLLVTLGRVPQAQVPELLARNWGNLKQPRRGYREGGGQFTFGDVTHSVRRLVVLPPAPAGKAVATELDLREYVARMKCDAGDRGVFVLKLEQVEPRALRTSESSDRMLLEALAGRTAPAWEQCVALLPAASVGDDEDDENPPLLAASIGGRWHRLVSKLDDQRLLLVTDLGLIVKRDASRGRDAWVLSLEQGTPVQGVEYSLVGRNGETLFRATGDEQGHARFPYDVSMTGEREPLFLLARKGEDFSFLPMSRMRPEDWGRAHVWGLAASHARDASAAVLTDRGIYRPGETMRVGFVVKREDWGASLAGLPVKVETIDSRGHIVDSFETRVGKTGLGERSVELPADAPTGVYQVRVGKGNGWDSLGTCRFRVEEFEPDRMKITGHFAGAGVGKAWIAPENAAYALNVQNLYGTPAAGRRASVQLLYGDEQVAFPAWKGWDFHAPGREQNDEIIYKEKLGDLTTSGDGSARFPLPLDKFAGATYSLCVQAEAFEQGGGRSVRTESKTIVSPWPWLLASKPDGNAAWVPKGSAFSVGWLAVDPELAPISPDGLRLSFEKRHESVELSRDESGHYYYDTVKSWEPAGNAELPFILENGRADVRVDTSEAGTFRMLVTDAQGRLRGMRSYTVVGNGGSPDAADRSGNIAVRVENKIYAPGETVEIAIDAPFAGSGLATLEREKVWASQPFRSEGTHAVVSLRIPDDAEGTLYATVCYVRAADSPEVYRSPFGSATVPLRVERPERANKVSLSVPERAESSSDLRVAYRAEKPCHMIVFGVDEGILQYARYRLPNLRDALMKKRALEVRTYQWLSLLLPEYRLLNPSRFGGGDALGAPTGFLNPFARHHEKSVAFWSGVVEAGPEEKTLSWHLPDYFSGRLRIMALAVGEETLGSCETQTLVQAPLILMPVVPAFAAPGDRFRAHLNVTNMLGLEKPSQVVVSVASSTPGWTAKGEEKSIELAPGQEGNVSWEMEAPAEPGAVSLKLTAKSEGRTIEREAYLSVRPSTPYETRVTSGYFRQKTLAMKAAQKLLDAGKRRTATAAGSPVALLDGLACYMREYPYTCTEQLTSRAAVASVLAKTTPSDAMKDEAASIRAQADSALDERRNLNGSYGAWGVEDEFSAALNLHVAQYFVLTGETESERSSQLAASLERFVQERGWNLRHAPQTAEALYLLARMGNAQGAALLALRDALEQDPGNPWKQTATGMHIAAAYALMQKKKEAEELARSCVEAGRKAPPARGGGTANPYAGEADIDALKSMTLAARHFPNLVSSWGYKELEPMLDALKKNLFNTYDAAYVALAVQAWHDCVGRYVGLAVEGEQNGAWTALAPSMGGTVSAPIPDGVENLRFGIRQDESDFGAFYQIVEAGYDAAPENTEVRAGLEISRVYLDEQGRTAAAWTMGDPVTVRLRVRNLTEGRLEDIAVTDLLPGASQVVAGSLEPGADKQPGVRFVDMREDRNVFYVDLDGDETLEINYRLKPLTPGSFALPAVTAEHMYKRTIRARSGGGRVNVAP